MNAEFREYILNTLNAFGISEGETLQTLWSGYGNISRYKLSECNLDTVIIKHIVLPENTSHPRGWNSSTSHQRKVKSYQVETSWYTHYSKNSNSKCRMPLCYGSMASENEYILILEDLDASGFPVRKQNVNASELKACISWLANFHASYMNCTPQDLWPTGCYWHLETRPDELEVLQDLDLKKAAPWIDQKLKASPFQTLVHGDAKLENFCFSNLTSGENIQVAALDFQYVGQGCGIKDLAYFLGSCLADSECEEYEEEVLSLYFKELKVALEAKHIHLDFEALEKDWRELYPLAWTDFHRFLKGWSPGHWKINSYSERLSRDVIKQFLTQNPKKLEL